MTIWLNEIKNSHVHYLKMGLHPLLGYSASVLAQPHTKEAPVVELGSHMEVGAGDSGVSQR